VKRAVVCTIIVLLALMPLFAGGKQEAQERKPVTLVYWTHWEQMGIFNNYYVEKGREYAAMHPDELIGVELVTIPYSGYEAKFLSTFNAQKGAPDFFNGMAHIWGGLYKFADRMPEELADRVDEQLASYLKPIGVLDGVRYGIPVEAGNFQQLYVNVDMFQEAGLDPNVPPATFDDLLEYAKKMTKYDNAGNVARGGFGIRYSGGPLGISDKNLTIMHAFGGRMYDPEKNLASGVVNSKESVEALAWIGDLIAKHKVTSLEVGSPSAALAQGRAAMILRESWLIGWLRDNSPNLTFKVYPAPRQRQVIGGGNLFPWANMVYANSPKRELTWRFVDFVFNPENDLEQTMAQGMLPVCQEGYDSQYVRNRADYDSVMTVLKQGPGPAYSYYAPKMNQLADVLGAAILDVMYSRSQAKPALDSAAAKMDAILLRE